MGSIHFLVMRVWGPGEDQATGPFAGPRVAAANVVVAPLTPVCLPQRALLASIVPQLVARDEPDIWVAPHDPGDGTVHPRAILTGAAEDLYCRLWGRPPISDLRRTGDLVLVAEFEAIVSAPIR